MSRRDRHNRSNERPDFQEVRQSGGAESKITPVPKKPNVVIDPDEGEEGDSFVQKMGTFFGGCYGKIAGISSLAVHKPWGWCCSAARWTWSGLKTIPSYCVLRGNRGSDEEDADDATNPANAVTVCDSKIAPATPRVPSVPPVPAKIESNVKPASKPASDYEDEDELATSRWWSLGIKSAAAALAALIFVGGYFGVTSLLSVPVEIAGTSNSVVDELDAQDPASSENMSDDTHLPFTATPEPVVSATPAGVPVVESPAVAAAPTTRSFAPPGQPGHTRTALPEPRQELLPPPPPQENSLLSNNSLFDSQEVPVAPAVAETMPPIAGDPFGLLAIAPVEPPAPVLEADVVPAGNVPESVLNTLQPLASRELDSSVAPQLQPLVALDSSALPPLTMAAAPVATEAPASPQVAANFGGNRQATRNANNANTSRNTTQTSSSLSPPSPPVTNTIPPTTVQQTVPITEPIREIVPLIPASGTVQNVPPLVAPPPMVASAAVPESRFSANDVTPNATTLSPTDFMISQEPVPGIPKDAPVAATSAPVVVAVPPPPPSSATATSASQHLPVTDLPMDRQLWDQVRELRGENTTEQAQLRFSTPGGQTPATTAEPALRFTPRQDASSTAVADDNLLAREAMNSFSGLLPADDLSPANLKDIEKAFSALDAPKPVWAEAQPKYRDDASGQANNEGGLTFQSRINSQISRSPQTTETYIVQRGDTYMTISDKFYGTSLLYIALARHNQTLGIDWRPAEGVVIEIPTADFLRTHYGEAANRQRHLESQQSAVRYIVQEGDTIFRLATDKLRDSTRWREIYALNMDRLQDVRDLRPGMEILLPVETARNNRQQTY